MEAAERGQDGQELQPRLQTARTGTSPVTVRLQDR